MLSIHRESEEERVTFSLHTSARLVDRDEFIDGIRHYQDNSAKNAFERALSDFNSDVDRQSLTIEDFAATDELLDDIEGLSSRPLRLGGSIGMAVARPGRTGVAGFARVYAIGGGIADFVDADRALVDRVLDFARSTFELRSLFGPYVDVLRENSTTQQVSYQIGGIDTLEQELRGVLRMSAFAENADALVAPPRNYHDAHLAGAVEVEQVESLVRLPDFHEELQFSLELQGSLITEAGISFARRLSEEYDLSLGATLKNIKFETFDYRARIMDVQYPPTPSVNLRTT